MVTTSRACSRQSGAAPRARYQAKSAYARAAPRPIRSTAVPMTSPTTMRRRRVMSNGYAVGGEPALHLATDFLEVFLGARLESQYQNRLSVGRSDEPPSISKENSDSVNVDDLVARLEILLRLLDHLELSVIGAVHSQLGGRDESRHVGKHLMDAFAGGAHNS